MKARGWVLAVAVLAAVVATRGTFAAESARPARAPNIVFLLADQWRASATGYEGDPNVKTPNLDRLAAQSVRFRNAVSVCPVCTPYRAALMTGRFPTSTGMFLNDAYLPDKELCLAEMFRTAGYRTAYIGKWHLDGHGRSSYIPPERRQGWQYWKGAECDHNYQHSHYYADDNPEKQFWEGYDAVAETHDAEAYLRAHAHDPQPQLLFVAYGVPHFPHQTAPEEFRRLYPPESIKLPPTVPAELQEKALKEAQGYYAHCSALDQCIGDVVRCLDELHLAQNTILVFTADHGEMLGSHGGPPYMKHLPWDESARVPLLIRYPAAQGATGRVVTTAINTPDLTATLLGLAGVAIPKSVEGDDLSPLVRGGPEQPDRAALYMAVAPFAGKGFNKEYRAIRTSRYTYVRGLEGPWLLFDDQHDRCQEHNLVGDAAHAALQQQLDAKLQAALQRIGDDFRPAAEYVKRWGYDLAPHGSISYKPGSPVQSPQKQ